jgi:hypothetical protein
MFDLAVLSAYISILALTFLSIVLFQYESKRSLSVGFILESIVIILSMIGVNEYVGGNHLLYTLRIISALLFIIYAIKVKRN